MSSDAGYPSYKGSSPRSSLMVDLIRGATRISPSFMPCSTVRGSLGCSASLSSGIGLTSPDFTNSSYVCLIAGPKAPKVSGTIAPAFFKASDLARADPSPWRPSLAPACPNFMPLGRLSWQKPDTTDKSLTRRFFAPYHSAARSSRSPPISPTMTTALVCGSFSNISRYVT